ncbi:hypothetical protein HYW40_01835 [Candidatus Curtissbacteria bacterium]|nr:hypothetical protein [Candidatus Curtissbacteria bacterium]
MQNIPTKGQKLRELKRKLRELEEVKLKEALARYGEAFQDSSSPGESAAWELADEEVSVLRAMVAEIKVEIKNLERPLPKSK